jgi:broad specificity phosphatase PhoE
VEILLVRHGEMEFEEATIGSLDLVNAYATGEKQGPLSPRGVGQAGQVSQLLASLKPQALYSSTFIRARETAEATARVLGLPVQVIPDLGEVNVGRLSPKDDRLQAAFLKTLAGLRRALPPVLGEHVSANLLEYLFIVFCYTNWHLGRTAAGESFAGALQRIRAAFEEVAGRHADSERVAVFTHGYFIHLLVNRIVDRPGATLRLLRRPYIRHGSITRLVRGPEGGWRVKGYMETSHLR